MSPPPQRFGNYLISCRSQAVPVRLDRAVDEAVFLAFDTRIRRLVELHVLKGGEVMNAVEKRSALDRARLATEVRGNGFMRLLEAGEDNGVVYFSGNLNDGEFAEDYVSRRGPLPAVTVFCLMQSLLDDLVAASSFGRLLSHMRMRNPLVTTLEDVFLQLRVVDYGFSDREQMDDRSGMKRVVADCCRLIFLLLTGQPFEGQNPDRFPALTALPTNLRAHVRSALANPDDASPNLEKLRDELKEAYAAQVSSLQARASRKHIAVTDSTQPLSKLQDLLLENVVFDDLLKGRFEIANGDDVRRYPFSIPARNSKTEQAVTVQLLPPMRIVDRGQMEAVPLQTWRFSPERHPNILRALSLWETPDWTFLTEEREPGFTLSRLMAERVSFNPPEVLAILKQVRAGMDQARECGVGAVDVHPSNLVFRVGKGGAIQGREFEKLMLKRIDAWPPFVLKLRTHTTMRSLYEPPLVEPHADASGRDPVLAAHDLRCRTFAGLGVYLLTGERQVGATPQFGDTVPEALAAYLRECVESQRKFGGAPEPDDFIAAFEKHMAVEDPEGRGFAAIRNAASIPADQMESAGSVSDFDNDFGHYGGTAPDYLVEPETQRLGVAVLPEQKEPPRGLIGMVAWGVIAFLLLLVGLWLLDLGSKTPQDIASNTSPASSKSAASDSLPVADATTVSPDGTAAEPAAIRSANPASKDAGTTSAPPAPRPRLPEQIRKAVLPSMSEVQKALQQQREEEQRSSKPSTEESNQGLARGSNDR